MTKQSALVLQGRHAMRWVCETPFLTVRFDLRALSLLPSSPPLSTEFGRGMAPVTGWATAVRAQLKRETNPELGSCYTAQE